MAEQSLETPDLIEGTAPVEAGEPPREISDYEKKLRREVSRYREQAKIAESDRDAACAAAARDRDAAVAAARDEAKARILQAELRTQAVRLGIVDLDGLRLADLSGLNLADTGEVQGAEEAVTLLRQHKPYLFASDKGGAAAGTTSQLQRPPAPASPSALDARSLTREAWQAERDKLLSGSR